MSAARLITTVLLSSLVFAIFPFAVSAQSSGELEASIRAAILTDPRTTQMSEEEIDAMVATLAQRAQAQGVSAADIEWRPQETVFAAEEEPVADASCGIFPAFFCALSVAFGLDGSDVAIPIMLGITAGILLFVIGAILHHRYGRHPIVGKFPATAPQNPPPPSQGSSLYQ